MGQMTQQVICVVSDSSDCSRHTLLPLPPAAMTPLTTDDAATDSSNRLVLTTFVCLFSVSFVALAKLCLGTVSFFLTHGKFFQI